MVMALSDTNRTGITSKERERDCNKACEHDIQAAHEEPGDKLVACKAPVSEGRLNHIKYRHTVHLQHTRHLHQAEIASHILPTLHHMQHSIRQAVSSQSTLVSHIKQAGETNQTVLHAPAT